MRYIKIREHNQGGKKFTAYAVGLITILCLISFFVSQSLVTTLPSAPLLGVGRSIQSLSGSEAVSEPANVTRDIEDVLEQQRKIIATELKNYHFPAGKFNISAKNLKDFVPESGGTPIRSIIIATWRSGSTFLGDVLNSVPGNYYHYEPLLDHGIVQVRGPPLANTALRYINQLLNCNYTDMDNYLLYGQDHNWLFTHNTRLWDKCLSYPHLCWNPQFLSKFCSIFPFQSMKLVRLRLNLIEALLEDPKLGIRVLLVVRDPRGTMQSRKHRDWCPGQSDCWDPTLLCADLTSDYSAAIRLHKKYPNTFRAVRYEDISLNPYKGAESLLNFFGRYYGPTVKRFLDTHTKINVGGVSSTFRNSRVAPFHWRNDLSHSEVLSIQRKCLTAMSVWGYVKAHNASHQKTFNPITGSFKLD
ncbi:carbohydrate sulfotransferase 1-like [Rhodnius prolixus]|uniref:carbohydrate sulfotransferase 1-like n=1 Tax=Rhodnius prolixus TaxID=13249 RepID=UPI003D18D245